MRLIAGLLISFLGKTGRIQAIFIRHISRAKVSNRNKIPPSVYILTQCKVAMAQKMNKR